MSRHPRVWVGTTAIAMAVLAMTTACSNAVPERTPQTRAEAAESSGEADVARYVTAIFPTILSQKTVTHQVISDQASFYRNYIGGRTENQEQNAIESYLTTLRGAISRSTLNLARLQEIPVPDDATHLHRQLSKAIENSISGSISLQTYYISFGYTVAEIESTLTNGNDQLMNARIAIEASCTLAEHLHKEWAKTHPMAPQLICP